LASEEKPSTSNGEDGREAELWGKDEWEISQSFLQEDPVFMAYQSMERRFRPEYVEAG